MALPTPQPYIPRPPLVWALPITAEALAAAADVESNQQYQDALTAARLTFAGASVDGATVRLDFILANGDPAHLVGALDDYLTWTADGTLHIVPKATFEASYELTTDPTAPPPDPAV